MSQGNLSELQGIQQAVDYAKGNGILNERIVQEAGDSASDLYMITYAHLNPTEGRVREEVLTSMMNQQAQLIQFACLLQRNGVSSPIYH